MTDPSDAIARIEAPDQLPHEDASEVAPLDNEIDFDDERDDDQLTLDEVEAAELGVLLDDPEEEAGDD